MSTYLFSPEEVIERKFRILSVLGRGSFSEVYQAEDLVMGEICVLKVLRPVYEAVNSLRKLREEANIYHKLREHQHIAKLRDVNKFAGRDDLLYLKLEYIEGKTIEEHIRESQQQHVSPPPIPMAKTYQAILDLLDALDFMHTRSDPILHRDIKPSNLILSPSRGLVVVDFNVSKELVVGQKAQTLVGTPPYIPPEVILRETDWDITSDLYAVGVLLYIMLAGEEPPFPTKGDNALGIPLADLKEVIPTLPNGVINILNKAIAYNRQDRFQSAQEMKQTIEREWNTEQAGSMKTEAANMDNEPITPMKVEIQHLEVRRLLQAAREANAVGRFIQVDDFLAQAKQVVGDDKSLLAEYQSVVTSINTQRAQRASHLVQEIMKLLDVEILDETKITTVLDELVFLDEDRAQIFQTRFVNKLQERRGRQIYLEAKTECEALWRRAQELIAASTPYNTVLSQTYNKAVQVAEQAVAVIDIPELEGLLRTARREQEQARNRFEVLSTAAEAGAYREMMDVLNQEKDDSKMIQLIGPGAILLGTMTVREARQQITVMAEEFAHRKAMGYLEAARIHMEAHAPSAAKTELDRSSQLFMLNDEDKRRIQNYREKTVGPELVRFQTAQQLLEKARQAINPVESWQLVDKAYDQYEWLPAFDEVRTNLLPRLQAHIEHQVSQLNQSLAMIEVIGQPGQLDTTGAKQLLDQAQEVAQLANLLANYVEQAVRNIGQVQQKAHEAKHMADEAQAAAYAAGATEVLAPEQHALAQARAESARIYAQLAEAAAKRLVSLNDLHQPLHQLRQKAQELEQKAQLRQQLVQELNAAAQELRQLLQTNPAAAGNRWQALVTQYGAHTLEAFGPLNRLVRDLDARLNTESLIARLKQDFASNDPTRLTQAIKTCAQAATLKENLGFADELANLRGQLESRLAYLIGQSHVQAGDADTALKELAKVTDGPDVTKAQALIADIQKRLAYDQEVKRTLDNAQKLLTNKPRQAYQDLRPFEGTLSRYHEGVIQTLTKARTNWETQLLQQLQVGLSQPLDEDKVEQLRQLEEELRVGLGIVGHRLAKRVLAYCFAYEADAATQLREWDEAIKHWQKAIELERKPQYVNSLITAQKRQAEQLVREAPESAALILRELQREIHDDPELQYWAARLYVQQAQKPGLSAIEAETLYSQALQELTLGLEQVSERSGIQWAQLKGQLEKLQQDACIGQEVEQQKQRIERRLASNRTVREFHTARQDAEALLQSHPYYPRPELLTLPEWWRVLRQAVISKLETDVHKIPADQIWKRFEPLGKILALDEGHSQATSMLTQMGTLVRELEREVAAFAKDNEGLDIYASSDLEVLSKQIELIQDIQQRSDAVYETLIHFANHPVLSKQSGTALATLNTLSANLLATQGQFDRFNRLRNQVQGALLIACGSGDWSTLDRLLNEIADIGFSAHRTINALRRQRNHDQQRRQELLDWAKDLENHARQGNFIAALHLADRFQDKDTGDRDDVFGVQRRIQYQDPLTNQVRQGLGRVRPLLENKAHQLETIHQWLLTCGLRYLSETHNLVTNVSRETELPVIIDWSAQKKTVLIYKQQGNFPKAIELCEKVNHGNPISNTLALTEAIHRLNSPPLSLAQAESKLAQTLLIAADQVRTELKTAQTAVLETIAWLNQQRREWEDRWHAFTLANVRLRQVQKSWNPVRKTNRLQAAQATYNHALYACIEVCPEHPDLQGIRRME